ncbi:MAG TPA: hypothetical protein PLS90_08130 [Candidatus Sumerlaeota bacterium]|nr:MAG: hypothetical protein BWZ08_00098 [candidate division BRC1 bacterium ADurb.BinA292]HOE95995.1 hypothetical protein [Candidatus Sumerlaeota bacterium]HOR28411.1 hypothetical protein [Candidatus Sumerlaeota bacterium]HPK02413.1 hypothetical protein [Candidatus Sumerlaeota bacterium]
MIRQCCKCRRIWKEGRWLYPRLTELTHRDISHCYCDACFKEEMATLRAHRRPGPAVAVIRSLRRLFH